MKHWFVLRADALFFCICRRRLYVAYGSIGIGLEVGLKNGLMKKRTFLRNRSRTMCKADYWHLAAFGGREQKKKILEDTLDLYPEYAK